MKEARGMVVSAKMKKTVVVRIERLIQHPKFKKFIVQRTKLKARDEIGCKEGDIVDIASTRPVSKEVNWRVVRVVGQKAKPEAAVEVAS
jgi:small subunit ribosomal protein S17